MVQKLQAFCSEDLGSFYLDILKDRLYTTGAGSRARRSAQTALWHIAQSLLRLMAGLLEPVDGAIAWNGAAIIDDREAHRARLRYLGHLDAVKPHLSVEENLRFWGEYWDAPRARVMPALERVGLARLRDAAGRRLSAGQRRRRSAAQWSASVSGAASLTAQPPYRHP